MNVNKPTKLLLTGCARSGTTLLSAVVGGHKDINMLCESMTNDIYKLYGKPYAANKLIASRQIRLNQRGNIFYKLVNRIVRNLTGKKIHYRPFTYAKTCVNDYEKVIILTRDHDAAVKSMHNREGMPDWRVMDAKRKMDRELSRIEQNNHAYDIMKIDYDRLCNNTEAVCRDICNFLKLDYDSNMLKGYKHNWHYPQNEIRPT